MADPALLPALLLNEAQCRLHLSQPADAASLCTRVLEREPENVKALYRRALASLALHDYLLARRDLSAAAKLQPGNRDVRAKLIACKDAAESQKSKEKALYAAMIGGRASSGGEGAAAAEGGDGASAAAGDVTGSPAANDQEAPIEMF